jgi:copper transport protein
MLRLVVAGAACAALLALTAAPPAMAHSGLARSDPVAGATLGASPTTVKLFFSERPEASLSQVRVVDSRGSAALTGPLQAGDDMSLVLSLPKLRRGVYTVTWRAVSAVDGHASSGAYAFGVEVSPRGAAVAVPAAQSDSSALEVVARGLLLIGLIALLGATVAAVARFGGPMDWRLAAAGWVLSAVGLALLAVAQRRTAGSSLGDLLGTPVGEALLWRALALALAGAALLVARREARFARAAMAVAAVAALGCIVSHVAAGHAAAGSWPSGITVLAQVAHFAAAGVWFGGLAALLLGVRGAPSDAKAAAVRRFSGVALGAVVLVAVTGTLRSVDEIGSWGDIVSTGYGRAVLAKIALLVLVVALAARNRRRSVPAAGTDLGPLRRTSRLELGLATAAVATAALLGTLAPAVAGQAALPQGLSDSGADFATTVRVRLTTTSSEPGANRFVADVEDYDSGDPVRADAVRLRFVPLDDPQVEPTSLALRRGADGSYSGSGANLTFDGRWGVTVQIERGGDAVEVPLTLDVRGPTHDISVLRLPNEPAHYTMQVGDAGYVQTQLDPERAGPSKLTVFVLDFIETQTPTRQVVVTTQAGDGPVRQVATRRRGKGWFEAPITLTEGTYKVTVVATTQPGVRLRAPFEFDIPGG